MKKWLKITIGILAAVLFVWFASVIISVYEPFKKDVVITPPAISTPPSLTDSSVMTQAEQEAAIAKAVADALAAQAEKDAEIAAAKAQAEAEAQLRKELAEAQAAAAKAQAEAEKAKADAEIAAAKAKAEAEAALAKAQAEAQAAAKAQAEAKVAQTEVPQVAGKKVWLIGSGKHNDFDQDMTPRKGPEKVYPYVEGKGVLEEGVYPVLAPDGNPLKNTGAPVNLKGSEVLSVKTARGFEEYWFIR